MNDPRVTECLLDWRNSRLLEAETIGSRILISGRRRLWNPRRIKPDTVVVHYISAVNIDPRLPFDEDLILKIFCDLGVSSHYLVGRDGAVLRLVPENCKAWHCGGSVMPSPDNRRMVNDFSIGIELAATAESGFTDEQYETLRILAAGLEERYGSLAWCGHEDIAGTRAVELGLRTAAKTDPGPLFDWGRIGRRKSGAINTV